VRAFGGTDRVATAAVRAGADLLLYTEPGEASRARRVLRRGLRAGTLSRAAFEDSAGRVLRLRRRLSRD
jgi:beta-glucosidase-like glycosyl hydrolase